MSCRQKLCPFENYRNTLFFFFWHCTRDAKEKGMSLHFPHYLSSVHVAPMLQGSLVGPPCSVSHATWLGFPAQPVPFSRLYLAMLSSLQTHILASAARRHAPAIPIHQNIYSQPDGFATSPRGEPYRMHCYGQG